MRLHHGVVSVRTFDVINCGTTVGGVNGSASAPAADWRERLHASGLRATPRRLAVLDALDAHPHASADALHLAVGPERMTRQAVYLNLNELVDCGIVRRITGVGPARYETRSTDNHHHLFCDQCASIVDIDCAIGDSPCIDLPASAGMNVRVAEITFRGLCPACAGTPAAAAHPELTTSQPPSRSKESL